MKKILLGLLVLATIAVLSFPVFAQRHGGQMTWSGDVDDTVLVQVHGDSVRDRTVHGQGTQNINVEFDGRLPHRPVQVFISDWTGRGEVRVVRQPDPENDYTATVRIYDPQPGRGHYSFSLDWRPIDFSGPSQ